MTKLNFIPCMTFLFLFAFASVSLADGKLIFEDSFDRSESNESVEQVGNGWGTNSKSRAQGNKQVDLAEGALHIYRHAVADHGVSVVQDLEFKDAEIALRFRIGKGDELGINIADMNEKSVHAGHICMAKIRLNRLVISDLKTGRMKLQVRERNKAKKLTADDKLLIASKEKPVPIELSADKWHRLQVIIRGETMTVRIDDQNAGEFTSSGIGHASKSRIRLAVAKSAWVDDVAVYRIK